MKTLLNRVLGVRPRLAAASQTGFEAIMAQARQVEFYRDLGVPDTFEGRFELAVLHAALAMRRWREVGDDGRDLAQAVFDRLFSSFDYALREIGTGDLTVGKKIRKLGEAFYGRARAYDAMLDESENEDVIRDTLKRNGIGQSDEQLQTLSNYILKVKQKLESADETSLLKGELDWPSLSDAL